MADRTARILIGVDADTASAEKGFADVGTSVDKLGQKVDDLGADATAVVDPFAGMSVELRGAFQRAEQAADKFQQKLETGSVTGPRDLRKTTIAQTLLNLEIEKSGKTLDQLGPHAQAAYAKLGAAQKQAIEITDDLGDSLEHSKNQVNANEAQFTGLGDAIGRLNPKAKEAVAYFTGVTGALAAGLAMGQQFNQFAKTDMSEWDDQMSLIALRAKELGEAFGELWLAQIQFIKGAATLDWKTMQDGYQSLKDGVGSLTDAVATSNDELRKQRDALKSTAAATDEKAVADKKAADEASANAKIHQSIIDGQAKHAEEVRKAEEATLKAAIAAEVLAGAIRDETNAVDSAALALDKATTALRDSEAQSVNFQHVTDSVAAALEIARAKAQALADEYGENSSAAHNARTEVDLLEGSLKISQASTEKAAAAVEANSEKQDAAAIALDAHAAKLDKLKSGQETIAVTADAAAAAAQRLASAGAVASAGMLTWSNGVGSAASGMSGLATASANAATPVEGIATGFESLVIAAGSTVTNLAAVNAQLIEVAKNATAAATALRTVGEVE